MRNLYRMMRILEALSAAAVALLMAGCSARPATSVEWTEGAAGEDARAVHRLAIVNPPKEEGWSVWFCAFKEKVQKEGESPLDLRYCEGSLYQVFPVGEYGDTAVLCYSAPKMARVSRAPKGFYLLHSDGKAENLETRYNFQPAERLRTFNYSHVPTKVYDMVPSLKSVREQPGSTKLSEAETVMVDGHVPGWYRITLDGKVKVEASDEDGAFYAGVTLDNLKRNSGGGDLPDMVIEDWPDLGFRGFMLDVSRNFTRKDDLLRLLDILAHYKVNRLHLHLGDDEGWRLEIPGLPELTSYGARRGAPTVAPDGSLVEDEALQPSYSGGGEYDDPLSPANGFYSREDFIEILRHAAQRRIHVIPEFDTPGHSRASIKAMEYRFRKTGDKSFLLSEPEDTSRYESVQHYHDNAINVALESTYSFIAKVFDEVIAMYAEAGAPLDALHIGGDEVPRGAWTGSPSCRKLMQEKGWDDVGMLRDYFMYRVAGIAAERGVKIAGWQEFAQNLTPRTSSALREVLLYSNIWSTHVAGRKEELPYKFANDGLGVVLSNFGNTYMDFAYNPGKLEYGLDWGGFVDERRAYSLLPFDLYKSIRWNDRSEPNDIGSASEGKTRLDPSARDMILGVQAQLWSETLLDFDYVTYYILPKSLGVFERGWNARPSWEGTQEADDPEFLAAFDRFYSTVQDHEVPWWESCGFNYRKY